MKKYIIKKHCEATYTCTIAMNRVQDYYYGVPVNYLSRDFIPADETTRLYGYDSREEAKKRLDDILKSAKTEESGGYWIINAEILAVEV